MSARRLWLALILTIPVVVTARPFELTVDSIMRGPALVGYAPTGLRWSGDSKTFYFEWRQYDEDEAGTWAVSRRQITRTTDREENPRWARNETHVTFTRNNNLFIVALDQGSIVQLKDVKAKKRESRETSSQKFLKEEEKKLIDYTRQQADRKKKRAERDKKDALPVYEIEDRRAVAYSNKPPDVYLMANKPGAEQKQVTTSTSDEWRSFGWVDPQLVQFRARMSIGGS